MSHKSSESQENGDNAKPTMQSSLLKRPFDSASVESPVTYAKGQQLSVLPAALPEIKKAKIKGQKVHEPPSCGVVSHSEEEERDVVSVELGQGAVAGDLNSPTKITDELPSSSTSSNTDALPVKNQFLNMDILRRRILDKLVNRGLDGITMESLHLLDSAVYEDFKGIIKHIFEIAKHRIESDSDKRQVALVEEHNNRIKFLNELQDLNGGGRFPLIPLENVSEEDKNVTKVKMKDCMCFMETSANYRYSELLYKLKFLYPN